MTSSLPATYTEFKTWNWNQIELYYQELITRPISSANVEKWLKDWTRINHLIDESRWRRYVALTRDTTDQVAKTDYAHFLDEIFTPSQKAEQKLKEKLLSSALTLPGLEIPLRNIRWEAEIFREGNLPLLNEELKLSSEYDKIIGAQTVIWEGEEITISQLIPVYQSYDREERERAWRLAAQRQLEDRSGINDLWNKLMEVRKQIAYNAGLPDYRAYVWKKLLRFDYTPADCNRFHQAIEEEVVPAAQRIYKKRSQHLGVQSVCPWDLDTDPLGRPPLRPFKSIAELESKTAHIFQCVDPQLGEYYEIMRREGLLDLENRRGKAPGGYCDNFRASKRPFIFVNAVGLNDDVITLLHEGGHAFHMFETNHLAFHLQMKIPEEFSEVASTAMEFLGMPYLTSDEGGFYSTTEATRARIEHIERVILFMPYMAVVDAFQHWVYENHEHASTPANCDAKWAELWKRFMVGEDWGGLEDEMKTGWQRKMHIIQDPFYYIEYGFSQLGAVQIWQNSLGDPSGTVAAYRKGLALGGTVTLPELYAAAGASFSFDSRALREAVNMMEEYIDIQTEEGS
jgi:oligoendopeptidase F